MSIPWVVFIPGNDSHLQSLRIQSSSFTEITVIDFILWDKNCLISLRLQSSSFPQLRVVFLPWDCIPFWGYQWVTKHQTSVWAQLVSRGGGARPRGQGNTSQPLGRVAGLGRLSAGANMAMKPFVKRVITIFATNASFLRVISNFRI